MSQYAIENMPSDLIRRRINEGWMMYKELCNVLGKHPSGNNSDPNSWRSYPEIKQFIDVMRYAKIVLNIRAKGIKKTKKLLEEKRKGELALQLARERKEIIEQLWDKEEKFTVDMAMKQLKFQDRENCIKYFLFCPFNFTISGSSIIKEKKLNMAKEILERNKREFLWNKKKIVKPFEKLIDIPHISNEFAKEQWRKFEGSLAFSKNKFKRE